MQPAADQADLAGRAAGLVRVAGEQPRRRAEPGRLARRPATSSAAPGPPTRPTTRMPGSQTEIGPWRNSSGSYALVGTWLVSVSFRPHSAAIPNAGPPPRITTRRQSRRPQPPPDVRGRRRLGPALAGPRPGRPPGASSPATRRDDRSSSASMLANDRVITIAASSPAGETSVTSARRRQRAVAAAGDGERRDGRPRASAPRPSTASDVEPEREMMTTGSAGRGPRPRRDEHAVRPEDQLRERRREHRPAHRRPGRRRRGLGQVVGRAGAGDDDPLGRGEERRAPPPGRRRPPSRRPRSPRPRSSSRARSAGRRRSVIGRAAPRSSGSGRRGPCCGRTRSARRPGRTRSARPAAPARRAAGRAGPPRRPSAGSARTSRGRGSGGSRSACISVSYSRTVEKSTVSRPGNRARRQIARLDDERVLAGQPQPPERDDRRAGRDRPSASATSSAAGSVRRSRTLVPGCRPCRSISRLNE